MSPFHLDPRFRVVLDMLLSFVVWYWGPAAALTKTAECMILRADWPVVSR